MDQDLRPRDADSIVAHDHTLLDALFTELEEAFAADARCELRATWDRLERELERHIAFEERDVLPRLDRTDPADAAALRREHGEIRRDLDELSLCVDLHALDAELAARFRARLRNHTRREEALLHLAAR